MHRLHEAYYLDEFNRRKRLSALQGVHYLFVQHQFTLAVGGFCSVLSLALGGFFAYHVYLLYEGTTTNETFKWSDLKRARQTQHDRAAEGGAGGGGGGGGGGRALSKGAERYMRCWPCVDGESKRVAPRRMGAMPKNIYNRGFLRNAWEMIYPLSSRPADGFTEAIAIGGTLSIAHVEQAVRVVEDSEDEFEELAPATAGEQATAHAKSE